jgi:hypothetical protein
MSPISSRNSVPFSACSNRPVERVLGAGEGAFLVPEQFGFDQIARNGRHVDGDERPVAALAVFVQRARDQFLAGAGFPVDHHRQIGLHQPGEHPVDVLHGRRPADQRHAFVFLGAGPPVVALRRDSASARPTMPVISSDRTAWADIHRRPFPTP